MSSKSVQSLKDDQDMQAVAQRIADLLEIGVNPEMNRAILDMLRAGQSAPKVISMIQALESLSLEGGGGDNKKT